MAQVPSDKTLRDSVVFKHFDLTDEELTTQKALYTKCNALNHESPKPECHTSRTTSFESISTSSQSERHVPHFFGDDGLIGAVTDNGELLSVMKYAGFDGDGFVYVEAPVEDTEERLQKFSEIVGGRLEGIGLRLRDRSKISKATMTYVHDRWPRVSYEYGLCNVELQTFVRGDIICQQFIAHNTSSEDAGLELLLDLRLGARWNYDDIMPGFVFGKSGGYSLCLLAGKSPQELVEMSVQVFRDGKMEVIQPSFLTKPEDAQGAEQSGNTPYPLLRQHLLKHVAAGSSQELTVEYKIRKVIIESTPTIGAGPRTSLKTSEADTSVGPSMASSTDSKPHRTMSLTEMDESLEKKAKAMLADEVMPYIDVTASLNEEATTRRGKWLQTSPIVKIYRRHLENILSVQSVPVPSKRPSEPAIAIITNSLDYNICNSSAGFYSFRFLLHMYTCLGEEDEALAERGLCDYLRERIYKVCSGQLAWSFNVARFQDRQWSQYHLVSGPVPSNLSGWSTGTEHVLKLYDYLKTFPNERLRIIRYIVLRVSSWLNGLAAHRDAKSQLWAFSSSSVQVSWQNLEYRSDEAFELPKYFLEIQVWIWKALSSIERILEEELNDQQHSQHEIFTNDIWNKMKSAAEELKIAFPVGTLRNLILERFTDGQTHNPESKGGGNKFILFSRCAKHNKPRTQLYWHSDGAFEVSNDGFFNDANGNLSQAWLNTLASQGVKRSKKTWKTSTNLSMSILMKTYEQFLNETCRTALKLANPIEQILSLVASSGMILTHEDMDPTKIPYIPEYHAEAVWVLMSSHDWRTRQSQEARVPVTSTASPDSSTSPTSPHVPTFPTKDYRPILKTTVEGEADKFTTVKQFAATDYDTQYATGRDKARNFGGGKIPKEVQPVVNMDNVYINFPPYWLYPDPDTFSSGEPPLTLSEKMSNLKKHVKWYYDEIPPVLEKGLMEYEQKGSFTFTRQPVNCIELIDIGTRSRRGDQTAQSKEFTFTSLQALALHLTGQRKREDAKKRFIYINACSSQEALVLYLGSPPSERYSTKGFIERYSSGTNWVKEDVFKTANLWVSELHLSFFVLVPSGQLARRDREDSLHQSLQRSRWSFASKRHDVSHSLRRAAISFRFVGDAYDKWWTCYTLSHIPHAGKWFDPNQYAYKDRADEKKRAQEDLHGQRRFLELVLMENITQAVLTDTSSILKFIDETLDQGESAGGGADKDSDIFDGELDAQKSHALSSEYVQFSKLLRIVQDNRRRMMETITEWNDREKQRRDQPRWSYEDEKEYRRPLDLKTRELKRNIARMKEQGDEIEWKLGDLKDSRAILSADLSLREARVSTQSSEDVRLFTYVTIIFLPLSFSSSLFSMQGLPENPVVNTFIILTTCALCITLLILVNLKTISRISGRVTAKVLTNVRQRMQTSFQDFWQRIARDLEIIEQRAIHQYGPAVTEEGSLEQRKPIDQSGTAGMARKRPYHQSKWWYLNFSFSYILLEMPARRVDSAWQVFALSKGQRTRLGSLRLAIRITIGLLWLPFLVSSHILSFTVINLWELPRLLYLQLSRGFHIFLQWLDEELPSEPQPIGENVSGGKDHGHSISRDQGRKTSVDNGVKGAASPSGQDSPQFSKASEERIKILSEPWKMSRAYPKWFKPKEDAGATESRAPMENNEDQNIDTRSEAPHGDRDKEKPDVRKWSPALKFLVSLLGRRKESQPQEANHGHNEGV